MVTSKDSVSLREEMDRALEAIQKDGTYQKIVDTWLNLS
jgi:ABC-type amino acid transport substrate-binding protein